MKQRFWQSRMKQVTIAVVAVATVAALVLLFVLRRTPAPTGPSPELIDRLAEVPAATRTRFEELVLVKGATPVHKWAGDIIVATAGHPTERDLHTVGALVNTLDRWTPGRRVRQGAPDANVVIYFVRQGEYKDHPWASPPHANRVVTHRDGAVISATIVIAEDNLDQARRDRHIHANLVRVMGFPGRPSMPSDTIFYGGPGWTAWQVSAVDERLIRLLYDPAVKTGLTLGMFREAAAKAQAATSPRAP